MRNKTPKIMKKGFLNVVTALCIGLFAACSQEEEIVSTTGEVETVSISAELPIAQTGTRGLPTTDDKHQLRCILEVWDTAENGKMLKRIEKLATEATKDGKLQFSFSVDKNVGYQCLLWADFIDAPATPVGEGDNATYTDKYYHTASLKAIDFKATDASLFNNPAADAFCGTLTKGTLSVTLKRPFAKVTLTDTSDYITGCTALGVTYNTPSGYNIATQTTTATTAVSATGLSVSGKNWFSTFIFAPQAVKKLEQDITMTFTKDGKAVTRTVKSGDISLLANTESNVSADFSKGEAGGEPEVPPIALKIGQFVNKDGSVVDEYDAENTVAIVFAVGVEGDDAIGNYGAAFGQKTIAGYAMALTSTALTSPQQGATAFPTENNETILTDAALTSYSGMKLTNAILSYLSTQTYTSALFNTEFTDWKGKNALTGENSSGWYIPSYQQLITFIGYIYGAPTKTSTGILAFPADITANDKFKSAVEVANAGTFVVSNTKNTISSSFVNGTAIGAVQINSRNTPETFVTTLTPQITTNTFAIRPVLTIFK